MPGGRPSRRVLGAATTFFARARCVVPITRCEMSGRIDRDGNAYEIRTPRTERGHITNLIRSPTDAPIVVTYAKTLVFMADPETRMLVNSVWRCDINNVAFLIICREST